jgi:hypothetical protein
VKVFADYLNKDGVTYNGTRLLSDLTGLSQDEIRWTATRLHHLLTVEHKSKDEAKAIVREEAKKRPWEKR